MDWLDKTSDDDLCFVMFILGFIIICLLYYICFPNDMCRTANANNEPENTSTIYYTNITQN